MITKPRRINKVSPINDGIIDAVRMTTNDDCDVAVWISGRTSGDEC
jgi:hypothetical protein